MPNSGEFSNLSSTNEAVVRLWTRIPRNKFHVDSDPLTVPANFQRYGLSELVNQLLGFEKPVPFDFLIHQPNDNQPNEKGTQEKRVETQMSSKFLRSSLHQFMRENMISAERTLNIEYIFAIPPLSTSEKPNSEEWVSQVECCVSSTTQEPTILVSSYDGSLKAYKLSTKQGDCTPTQEMELVYSNPVSEVGLTCFEVFSDNRIVLGDKDGVVRFGVMDLATGVLETLAMHSPPEDSTSIAFDKSVECMAVAESGDMLATSGWEFQRIAIWNLREIYATKIAKKTNCAATATTTPKKRTREDRDENASGEAIAPEFTVIADKSRGCISSLQFVTEVVLMSASMDSTVRFYDIVNCQEVYSLKVPKPAVRATYNPELHCLAVAHEDGKVSLWNNTKGDGKRQPVDSSNVQNILFPFSFEIHNVLDPLVKVHDGMITSLRWHRTFQLLTTGLDGNVKMWDLRASKLPIARVAMNDITPSPPTKKLKSNIKILSGAIVASNLEKRNIQSGEAANEDSNLFGGLQLLSGASDGKLRMHATWNYVLV